MIDLNVLPLYLTAVIALLLIPGPDMLLIASSSLSYGRKVGIFASLGNATSGILLTIMAAMGVSALIAVNPIALQVLRLLGGAYLLKMGWDCLRTPPADAPEELKKSNKMAVTLYRRAVFSNLLNPKALIFFVLFLPQFVSTHVTATSGQQMLVLGLLLNVLGLLFNLFLVTTVGTFGKSLLKSEKFRANQHKFMGLIFFVLAIWLLASQLPNPVTH
ncbi:MULTISPECIES: LysE family translocator [Photobacterium]|uniref:LysE family translocator n=1 Tax=Photobacterium leiognathi subsp. mandapamensis TaxID=48408 RepID=A0A2T3KYK0_PHOLD|nr:MULTISPECIES: LysE family translocator [Photobacterium]MBP2701642.1 LysE family translocator [Vibrio parahaemolyticus]MCG3886626.1 LysE family translocator [Photobacterium leiognathi]MZG56693.1 LysE family translocator [Photobacterium lucens]MZG80730.1 LysE family translocator [Photobacterium lucens]PHZ58483.1 LysE family translocator [Photobacterium leiognathi]